MERVDEKEEKKGGKKVGRVQEKGKNGCVQEEGCQLWGVVNVSFSSVSWRTCITGTKEKN